MEGVTQGHLVQTHSSFPSTPKIKFEVVDERELILPAST
jgi:hypothetical protein